MFTNNKILSTDLSTSIPQRRSIFAIFVHYGAIETTHAAIASLKTGTVSPDYIIIVDHADAVIPAREPAWPAGRPESKSSWIPGQARDDNVVIVRPGENTGYAGGLAAGLDRAVELGAKETDLCMLLNNDVRFAKRSLEHIATWWEKYGGSQVLAGAAGGYVSLLSGRAHIVQQLQGITPWNIPYIHGSCMVGELGVYSSISFPTSFFMYWEDVAISMRVVRRGGKVAVIPGLQGIHDDSHGSISPSKLFYMVRNGAYVLERYCSLPWRLYWYTLNTLRVVYHASFRTAQHKIIIRALRDARLGCLGRVNL